MSNSDLKRPADRRIYQRDIAERARVSISTVSRVLKNVGGISESVAQRVFAAAEELGYETASADKREQLQNVMLLTSLSLSPSLDPFHADILSAVEWACHEQEIHFSYASFNNGGTNADVILSRLQRSHLDGILLLSLDDPVLLEQVRALNVPIVMINVEALDASFSQGDYVLAKGTVGVHHGKPQLVLEGVEKLDPEPLNPAEFTPPPALRWACRSR